MGTSDKILNNGITLYALDTWADCKRAKSFFAEHRIEVNIKDFAVPKIAREVREKFGSENPPIILFKDKQFFGFKKNKDEIKRMLGI